MKRSWRWSAGAFGAVALVGIAATSCSSSSSSRGSAAGQSCSRTADCNGSLVCVDQTCVLPAVVTAVDAGADGSTDSGSGGGPVQLGQQCASVFDCAAGLTCVPFKTTGGLCDYASFGLSTVDAAGAMTCSGECSTAADCCELPVPSISPLTKGGLEVFDEDSGTYTVTPQVQVYLNSCDSILKEGLGGDPTVCAGDAAALDAVTSESCFYYQTYCACAANTWTCSATNACVYTGGCAPGRTSTFGVPQELGSCPTQTRATRQSSATCAAVGDSGTVGTCQSTGCTDAASCDGQVATGSSTQCQAGDCVCASGACYLPCAKDLDCAGGFACDTTTQLCTRVPPAGCTTDNDCVTANAVPGMPANAKAVCAPATSTCKFPCTNDHDCSVSSGAVAALGAFSGSFCSGGYCTPVTSTASICTSDSDCRAKGGNGTVNLFCVVPSTGPSTLTSAVTSGGD